MSLLDPVSQPKCQIKKAFMKVTDHSIEKIFLLDNSATRTVASGRELELPASLVTSHQSSGYERWPVTTSTEQMSARTESRLSRKLPRGLWDAGCEIALAESSNSSEVMWGDFQLYHTGKGELIITLLDYSPLEPCQCLGRGTAVISHALWIPHVAWILLIYYEQKLKVSKEVLHRCIYCFPVFYHKIFT